MIRQAVRRAVVIQPYGIQRPVDVVQDLVRSLALPGGSAAGAGPGGSAGDQRAVAQAGGVHLLEALVNVAVDDLIAVEPDALVEEGLRIPADAGHLFLLRHCEAHVLGEVEGAGNLLGHIRLDHGDLVGGVEEEVVVVLAGGGIGDVDGGNGLNESASGDDRHIPGPVRGRERFEDLIIDPLQFLHEERIGVIRRQPANRRGFDHNFFLLSYSRLR